MKLCILGAGPGGYVCAIRAAQLGIQVWLIEKNEVGGTCLNWGCIPTKAFAATAENLARARRLDEYGIELKGDIVPNLTKIIDRKNRIVSTQVKGIRSLLKNHGITLKEGHGRIASPHDIDFTGKDGSRETIESDRIIIATGSHPLEIPGLPFDGDRILSSDDILSLREVPKSLLIIGAGAIGCEFACIYREFGSDITIIETLSRALSSEDHEISELMAREFRKKKIRLLTNVRAEKAEIKNDAVHVLLEDGKEISAEKVLVSAGRAFNSTGIGADGIGLHKGPDGSIPVNGRMETNIPGIYAIGDVTGGLMLAHVASREGIVAAGNAAGDTLEVDYSAVPSGIFTSPEIASVGLREHDAMEKGIQYSTGHFQFRALGRAHAIGEIEGFVKCISEKTSDRILGVHIIGPHASDIIHECSLAISRGLRTKDIAETIHAHPTFAEAIREASEDVHGRAIHIPKK